MTGENGSSPDSSARSPGQRRARLCRVCAEVTGTTGAGIMLMSGDVPHGSLCTTDDVSAVIEQLQYDLGEGPCVDAYHLDRPVLEPDLADPADPRWLAFTGPAVAAGVRAVFGFPLHVGAVRLGALNLYCDRAGPLDDRAARRRAGDGRRGRPDGPASPGQRAPGPRGR